MGLGELWGRQSSKDIAKQRLKLVLIHDREDISPAFVEAIRRDMLAVLNKYIEIDQRLLDMELTRVDTPEGGAVSALICNIPFRHVHNMQVR